MRLTDKLTFLHRAEEQFRRASLRIISKHEALTLHLDVVEKAMDLCDTIRQFETDDENFKVIQVLAMRTFNAYASSLKLALSGYAQNSALLMRDILETIFLLDLFSHDRSLIEKWRLADRKTLRNEFSPVAVRKTLDQRDGYTTKRREEAYKMFCELAAHPSIKSDLMMRPQKNGDAVIGPFVEETALSSVISEMGRLAVQSGANIALFIPSDWDRSLGPRLRFLNTSTKWRLKFYPNHHSTTQPKMRNAEN